MRSRKHKSLCQSIEALEAREVKTAAITAALSASGVLTVTGTATQDIVQVNSSNSGVVVQRMLMVPNGPGSSIEIPLANIAISVGGKLQSGVTRTQVREVDPGNRTSR